MENLWIILVVVATLSWASVASGSSNEKSIPWRVEKNLMDAIHTRGRRQIMEANISPECRQTALSALSKAALGDSSMNCSNARDDAEDVGNIVLSIWDQIGRLMDDINMVVNAIPLCMSQYSSFNIIGKISCFFTNFKPIWDAVKDFWDFKDFWLIPYSEIKAFIECLHNKKSIATTYVNVIVENARSCN